MDITRLIDGFLGPGAGASIGQTVGSVASQASETAKSATQNMPGGLMGGAAAGGLMALLLGTKKGRKIGGSVLKYGGMAALGGLAYKAYTDYKTNQTTAPSGPWTAPQPQTPQPQAMSQAPADSGFDPALIQDTSGRDMRLSLVQAMISAAKADGHIDADENKIIMDQIDGLGLASDEKVFLFDQLRAPSDPIAIAHLARDERQATELYLASLLAIDTDTPEEQRYIDRLGDALRLPDALRVELTHQVAATKG